MARNVRLRCVRTVASAAFLIPLVIADGQAASRFFSDLPVPGPYAVGYVRDSSAAGLIHVWYPRAEPVTVALRLRDYVGARAASLAEFWRGAGVTVAMADSILDSQFTASEAGAPRPGPWPLVLVAQGNGGDVFDQVVLCEYLASAGFVVATRASPTLERPLTGEGQVGDIAHRQARELAAMESVAARLAPVATGRVAAVGHSLGARAALLLAMADHRVVALVSLDGGIGTSTATASFTRAPSFRSDVPLPSLLHFYETLDTFMAPDFALIERLQFSARSLERTDHLRHVHFSTYGFVGGVPELVRASKADFGTGRAARDVVTRTAEFLRRVFATSAPSNP